MEPHAGAMASVAPGALLTHADQWPAVTSVMGVQQQLLSRIEDTLKRYVRPDLRLPRTRYPMHGQDTVSARCIVCKNDVSVLAFVA